MKNLTVYGYCKKELAALNVLFESYVINVGEVDEYENLYERIKVLARQRAKSFETWDSIYNKNYCRAIYMKEHGESVLPKVMQKECLTIPVVRLRRRRRD